MSEKLPTLGDAAQAAFMKHTADPGSVENVWELIAQDVIAASKKRAPVDSRFRSGVETAEWLEYLATRLRSAPAERRFAVVVDLWELPAYD